MGDKLMNETYFKNGNFDLDLCKKDAENGSIEAIIILSNFYVTGKPELAQWVCTNIENIANYQCFESNFDKAIEWFEKAAELGSVDAMVRIANLYRLNKEDDAKAIAWLKKAAKYNYFPAMISLIELLDDKNEVENWILEAEKIANDYSAEDIFNFAKALRQNYFDKALTWYKVSADLGFKKAILQLDIFSLSSDYKKIKQIICF